MAKDKKAASTPKGAASKKPKHSNDGVRANASKNGLRSAATVRDRDGGSMCRARRSHGQVALERRRELTPTSRRLSRSLPPHAGAPPQDVQHAAQAQQEGHDPVRGAALCVCALKRGVSRAQKRLVGPPPSRPPHTRKKTTQRHTQQHKRTCRSCKAWSCPPRASSPTAAGLATRA